MEHLAGFEHGLLGEAAFSEVIGVQVEGVLVSVVLRVVLHLAEELELDSFLQGVAELVAAVLQDGLVCGFPLAIDLVKPAPGEWGGEARACVMRASKLT